MHTFALKYVFRLVKYFSNFCENLHNFSAPVFPGRRLHSRAGGCPWTTGFYFVLALKMLKSKNNVCNWLNQRYRVIGAHTCRPYAYCMFSLLEDVNVITKYKFTFRPQRLPSLRVKLPDFKQSQRVTSLFKISLNYTEWCHWFDLMAWMNEQMKIKNKPVGDMVCSLVWDCAHMSNAHLLKLTTSSVKLTGKLVGNVTRLVSILYRPILTSIAGEAF